MTYFDSELLVVFGLLLAVALFVGKLASSVRLPQVTAYLLVGVIFGPSFLHLVSEEHVHVFVPLTQLAVALVLFSLGCQFPLTRVRRLFRPVLRLSAGELLATFVLVALGLWLLGQTWQVSALLGTLALATAPATTVLVLKETESEGTITEYAQSLVAINNLVAIVAFELVFLGVELARNAAGVDVSAKLGELAWDLAGSVGLGTLAGLFVSYCFGLVSQKQRLVFLIAITSGLLGLCQSLGVSYMLAFLVMGIIAANTCYYTRNILAELDRLTGLLCVIFFATSGVELDLKALMAVGMIGAAYIVLRCTGKYFGIYFAAKPPRDQPVVRQWLGLTLFSQAGAAIALAAIAVQRDPELGSYLQVIILGTVPFFEIVGPICIRQSVIRAGEVPLAYAIPHDDMNLLEQLRIVWNRVVLAFGWDPWHRKSNSDLTVQQIMRKNIHPLLDSFTFDEVLTFIEHSRDNTYPVVNSMKEVVGVIRYRELSQELVNHSLGSLVRAADIATSASKILYADDPVERGLNLFNATKDDCLPVVASAESPELLGIVRRRDVLRLLIRRKPGSGGGSH